jgi:GalNAc5-diNAcBac-PP-undecaprenol beta-1,3-glucosyltransferase
MTKTSNVKRWDSNSAKPLVTVVIPTFERPEFIVKACLTAYNQTYENIEIIVVDDNSKTPYSDKLEELSNLKVKYIKRDSNGGGSAARNSGIINANGEYIAFLDDDDSWDSTKIEKQILSLNKSCRASHCGYKLMSNNQSRIESKDVITLSDLCENNKLASTSGLLCEAKLLKQVMFDSTLHKAQDWDIYLRIAKITSFSYVREALYIYDDGDHHRMTNRLAALTLKDLELKLDMLKKHGSTLSLTCYRIHVAEIILSSIKSRDDKLNTIKFCTKEIGFLSTSQYLIKLASRKLRNSISRPSKPK